MKARLLRALPVGVAGPVSYYGSAALVGPGETRSVLMLALFGVVTLALGFVVDAVLDGRDQ